MTHLKDALDRAVCAMPLLVMVLLAGWPRQADAQEIGDITAGRHLSETWCSSCHLVEAGATSGVSNGGRHSWASRAPEIDHGPVPAGLPADAARSYARPAAEPGRDP